MKRVVLLVLDSVGLTAAPDAEEFGDEGASTLGNIASFCEQNNKPFGLPNMCSLGLSRLIQRASYPQPAAYQGASAILQELSKGKDTTTGHWEIAGRVLKKSFPTFPQGFPQALLADWVRKNQLEGYLCNKPASGTTIIEELGWEHVKSGKPIVYTSADSVFQIACHEESFGLDRLYQICQSAREMLDPLNVARVIARPFVGNQEDGFERSPNRRDFSLEAPSPNLLDLLTEKDCFVAGVGKIKDIFAGRSVNLSKHTTNNNDTIAGTKDFLQSTRGQRGLIFANLIDFDQLHGHRRDPAAYADCLMSFDHALPSIMAACDPEDLLLITADHGNDPTFKGSDHTRELVPLLVWSLGKQFQPVDLGTLQGFTTIAKLTLEALGLESEINKIEELHSTSSIWKHLWKAS